MTERLYYNDSDLLRFDAVITDSGERDGRFFTVLNRSAFYPTSGGQSHDTGRLNDVAVIDVSAADDGVLFHWSERGVGSTGEPVSGVIDRERRQRNCRNHSGQHLLSAAFDSLYQLRTVSVHLGEEYAAVELETPKLTEEQLTAAELKCNEVVGDNIDIESLIIEAAEAKSYPLRKPPPKNGRIRIIRVGDFECSACGGTHCRTTGGIGLIKIIATEKLRGHTLVRFLTGQQAYEDYRLRFDVSNRLARDLTCSPADLSGKFSKLDDELRATRGRLLAAERELLPIKIEQLAQAATEINGHPCLVTSLAEFDPGQATKLALGIADRIQGLALLVANGRMIITAAESATFKAGPMARELAACSALKGGGNDRQAQLGGADPDRLEEYRAILEKILTDA